jgi:hypothetical protein
MSTNVLQAAKNLPLPERLELLDALWESAVEQQLEELRFRQTSWRVLEAMSQSSIAAF